MISPRSRPKLAQTTIDAARERRHPIRCWSGWDVSGHPVGGCTLARDHRGHHKDRAGFSWGSASYWPYWPAEATHAR